MKFQTTTQDVCKCVSVPRSEMIRIMIIPVLYALAIMPDRAHEMKAGNGSNSIDDVCSESPCSIFVCFVEVGFVQFAHQPMSFRRRGQPYEEPRGCIRAVTRDSTMPGTNSFSTNSQSKKNNKLTARALQPRPHHST